jgi:two-component system response regulator HydG
MNTISPKQKTGKRTPGQRSPKRVVLRKDSEKDGSHAPASVYSKADYSPLLEKFRVGLYIIQKGRFTYVNSVASDILGYESPELLIGKPFWELIHPDDRKRVNLSIPEENHQGSPNQHILRVFKKDGTLIWVRMGGTTNSYQEKPANLGHLMDVTSVKEMENSFQESLEKYQTVINEIEDAVAEVDLHGNVTFVNSAGCRIYGASLEESIGRNYRSWVDEETAKFVFQNYNRIFRTGMPGKNIVYEVIRKNDGRRRMVEDSVSLIRNADGEISGFRIVSRDISDRKEAEKELAEHRVRLEAIFGSVKDAVITVDSSLRVIEANKSMEAICGTTVEEIVGRVFSQCMKQCSRACCQVLRKTLEKKTTIREYRIECGPRRPHQQVVSVTSSPLVGSEANFMGAVLVIRDITLIRDMERELIERHRFENVIGKSKEMQEIYRLLEELADLETTVLITGESGTGKDLIAKALHYSGHRSFKPMITVNCSALAESLLESELFGHVRGAFTGAISDKQGRFQTANGGTILLDEIGDISPLVQLKLLRVLQEKEFERVGESIPQKVDVRVIATTNKHLKDKVRRGEFREDLYYRLKVVEISMPPLRERPEDLPLLVDHFTQLFNDKFKRNLEGVSSEVLSRFMDYPWPGNVRELEHVMERAFVLCRGRAITLEHLPLEIRNPESAWRVDAPKARLKEPIQLRKVLDALNKTAWNKAKAARLLGINRRTLYRKLDKHQIVYPE